MCLIQCLIGIPISDTRKGYSRVEFENRVQNWCYAYVGISLVLRTLTVLTVHPAHHVMLMMCRLHERRNRWRASERPARTSVGHRRATQDCSACARFKRSITGDTRQKWLLPLDTEAGRHDDCYPVLREILHSDSIVPGILLPFYTEMPSPFYPTPTLWQVYILRYSTRKLAISPQYDRVSTRRGRPCGDVRG